MMKALIVEDEAEIRGILVDLVEAMGHHALEASCLVAARELLNSHDIDFVLLDLKIPLRDDSPYNQEYGEMCLKEIRAHARNADAGIVVATSCNDGRYFAVDLIHAGADDFIEKPFDNGERKLGSCVEKALEKRAERIEQKRLREQGNGLRPFNGGKLVFDNGKITLDGILVCTSASAENQYDLLEFLAKNRTQVLIGKELAVKMWGDSDRRGENSVAKAKKAINKHLQEAFKDRGVNLLKDDVIASSRGNKGYLLSSNIQVEFKKVETSQKKKRLPAGIEVLGLKGSDKPAAASKTKVSPIKRR